MRKHSVKAGNTFQVSRFAGPAPAVEPGRQDVVEVVGLSAQAIRDLGEGSIDAIRVPDILDPQAYAAALETLKMIQFSAYDRARVFPPVARFGVSVNDYRTERSIQDTYWSAVREANAEWSRLSVERDLFEACRDALSGVWPHPVEVGRRGDRTYSQGIIREIDAGLQVHFDDALLEHDGELFDSPLTSQIAFNLYLSVPESGGELLVWRHRWQQADEAHKIPGGYGYDESVVAGEPHIVLPPRAGEAILFDPRNFHTVRPALGGRRIALAFSVGQTADGRLIAWA